MKTKLNEFAIKYKLDLEIPNLVLIIDEVFQNIICILTYYKQHYDNRWSGSQMKGVKPTFN